MSETRCDLCGEQHATVRYTEIDEGQVTKRTICRSCAEARGLLDAPPQAVAVLEKLLQASVAPAAPREPAAVDPELRCATCNWSLAGFHRTGRLGCPACWTAFEAQLVPVLRKIQPELQHVGKAPRTHARQAELRQRGADLRGELDRAIRGEDYERAAALRDEIRIVEQSQSEAADTPEPEGGAA